MGHFVECLTEICLFFGAVISPFIITLSGATPELSVTLLAFHKSIESLVIFIVLGHHVSKMIMVCFPRLFLASFLNYYVSVPVSFPECLAFLVCSLLPSPHPSNDST